MKYLEGNIFVNFYIFGAAGIIAVVIGGVMYARYGMKFTYIISYNMCILGCIGMLLIQTKMIKFDSEALRNQFDEKLMPILILLLKLGIIISYITTTQASFTDDRIFPPSKRNTSVGTCGMIARSVTIVAPIVNEWSVPTPVVIMLVFSVLGLAGSLTFPDEEEQKKAEKLPLEERQGAGELNVSNDFKNEEASF